MRKAAVIGDPISHSLSPIIFDQLKKIENVSDLSYEAIGVSASELESFIEKSKHSFLGMNVTLPHKEKIVSLADKLSHEVEVVGAANVVHFKNGQMTVYNTDANAITSTLQSHGVDIRGAIVLLFGAGGAARAACYALATNKARAIFILNRDGRKAQALVREFSSHFPATAFKVLEKPEADAFDLTINATSVGMAGMPIPHPSIFEGMRQYKIAIAFDLIYRPTDTAFLKQAKSMGAKSVGGLDMLIDQAVATWNLWLGPLSNESVAKKKLREELLVSLQKMGTDNLFLTGFMGAGKSTIGRMVAAKVGRVFCDLDELIEERTGRSVRDIFRESGEAYFREVESNLLDEVTHRSHQVVALGGGALLNAAHLENVKRAGQLVYLEAGQEVLMDRLRLESDKRPLLKSSESLAELFEARRVSYEKADHRILTEGLTEEHVRDLILKRVIPKP